MRVMINATGCPAPVLDRNRMNTHKHLSQLIASAVDRAAGPCVISMAVTVSVTMTFWWSHVHTSLRTSNVVFQVL